MVDEAPKHEFICEVCDTVATLTNDEAFDAGWDYPPFIGAFGVISPRTCPDCGMMDTVWAALVLERKAPTELTEKQLDVAKRIMSEQPR